MRIFLRRLGSLAAVLVACSIVFAATGCAEKSSSELFGYVPPGNKNVGKAFISEAETNVPFYFTAQPGELLIAYFGYTHCPDVCPTTLVAIKNAKKKIGELASRVDLAMATVDPERDTKDVLPRYLASLSDKFHALVPSSFDELHQAEEVFQTKSSVTKSGDTVEVVHSGTAYVIDENGNVLVEWPFGLDANSMAHDLTQLLNKKEATT